MPRFERERKRERERERDRNRDRERTRKNSKELLVLRVILTWPLDMGV